MVLGHQKVYDQSNEITAIPLLLGTLFIKGATITISAMGCQKVIAEKIVTGKADYILTVNGNQGVLEMICKRHLSMGGQMMSIPANRS